MEGDREEARDRLRAAVEDRESGAVEIARRAAEALAALPRADLLDAVRALVRAHPSMAPLWRLGSEALSAGDHVAVARSFAARIGGEPDAVARVAARAVLATGKPERIVLHSSSSTLAAAARALGVPALCGRSDPGGEGSAMAARIVALGVEAGVVSDEEAREAARRYPALVGADAIGPGGVVNKVGTRALAEAAAGGSRCLVLAGSAKLVPVDLPTPTPFERTPLGHFTAIVTEEAAVAPDRLELHRHPLHPDLAIGGE